MDGTRAPMPAAPAKEYSFTDFQVHNPAKPPPGDRLDAELARLRKALTAIIEWVSVSLSTDGSLRPGAIGKPQLVAALFDFIADDAIATLTPLKETVARQAQLASGAAELAQAAVRAAGAQHAVIQDAATRADQDTLDAANSAAEAAQSALEAASSANDAANSANHADGSEAVCVDYGVLTQAWAEHMPDTIPPNILAVMDVTGDHWSSRWWANQASQIVTDASGEAVCAIQQYWLGAYASPPSQTTCGEPIALGAMYWDLTEQVAKVYDGNAWHDVVQPVPGKLGTFLYLPTVLTTVFTGTDHNGNVLALDPVSDAIEVYLNGVKLLDVIDYTATTASVTLLLGAVTAPSAVEIVALSKADAAPPQASGVKVNTNLWVFDGTTRVYPLKDSGGGAINPASPADCIVSLNGIIQEPGGDFTTAPGSISFITAPEADADKWMVVGLPLGGG